MAMHCGTGGLPCTGSGCPRFVLVCPLGLHLVSAGVEGCRAWRGLPSRVLLRFPSHICALRVLLPAVLTLVRDQGQPL